MYIAEKLTIQNWEELTKILIPENDDNWDFAFRFFEERTITRYINPINAILDLKSYNGEGFAVVNLQCSLIEMLESFIKGWIYEYPNFINSKGIKLNGNDKIYKSFFNKRNPFKNYTPKIIGKKFYVEVRCGLLHETQTKNSWKIKKGLKDGIAYEEKEGFKIIYRDKFQRDLEIIIENYKKAIINGIEFDEISACELRENFIAKFNHICKVS